MFKNPKLQALLKNLPTMPGVYKMKDDNNKIIYVGKAKNLKNRVKSYFINTANQNIKTQKLVEQITDIEWISVNSENEALILETNYIKELRPKYNILMKDDKNFVYVRISVKDDFPSVSIVRELKKDGAKYFGPKTSRSQINDTLDFLRKIFPLHSCKLQMQVTAKGIICKGHEKYPCLEYQMKRCAGPCIGKISSADYHLLINEVINFLAGDYTSVINNMKAKMMADAQKQKFEQAAKIRDLIKSIENMQTKQLVSNVNQASQDVIGIYHDLGRTFISLFQIRAGKMINDENITLINEGTFTEMIQAFLTEFYIHTPDIPKEILIPKEIDNQAELEYWFQQILNSNVKILFPQKGEKNQLLDLAMQNAKSFAENERIRWESNQQKKEQSILDITNLINQNISTDSVKHFFPVRMECFDISHYSGEATVASLAVFINGEEAKSEYRHYKLKTLNDREIDDFKSMQEILSRRLMEIENTLLMQITYELPANQLIRKLVKSEVKKLLPLESNNDFYALFLADKLLGWVEIKKHNAQILEIKNTGLLDNLDNKQNFWLTLLQKLASKEIWILTSNKAEYENYGFKKLKTLSPNWTKEPGLVPIEISENNNIETGFALKVKIPKIKSKQVLVPDFILIDGGKGQLSTVTKIFTDNNWEYKHNAFYKNNHKIIVCSIAKKEEEIFFPYESNPYNLIASSEGSYLLQRLRDEAHRFAVTYNRNLRFKNSLKSELDDIEGLGPVMRKKLIKTFGSVAGIKNANLENLKLCVGDKMAMKIMKSLKNLRG